MTKQLVTFAACVLVAGVLALALAGCSGSSGPGATLVVPSAYQGTWIAAALDTAEELQGVSLFTVDSAGQVHVLRSDVIASGSVTATGQLTLTGSGATSTFSGTGTLLNDDTGTGTWNATQTGHANTSGTFLVWRANGSAYAGTWDIVVGGPISATGTGTVDGSGVISGTVTHGTTPYTVFGVVTGAGRVVVAWGNDNAVFFGNGPASGTASGSTATGTWKSDILTPGTWTATKR